MQSPKSPSSPSKMPPGVRLGAAKVQQKRASSSCNLEWFFKCFLCSVVAFYLGISVGWNMDRSCNCEKVDSEYLRAGGVGSSGEVGTKEATRAMGDALKTLGELVDGHKEKEEQWAVQLNNMKNKLQEQEEIAKKMNTKGENKGNDELEEIKKKNEDKIDYLNNEIRRLKKDEAPHHSNIFSNRHTGHFVSGMEFVDRDDFAKHFDTGVPLDNSGWANDQVLLLYSDHSAMPSKNATTKLYPNKWTGMTVEDATKNCRNLHIILSAEGREQQCIAILGQYESFHIQKFMRMANGEKQSQRVIDMNLPLRRVNRNMMINGEKAVQPPKLEQTKAFRPILTSYLNSLEGVLSELRPIAKSVASRNSHNTIIVMVCNYGHSEMLMNFVCNAHAKGEDTRRALQSVLVFSTDIKTHNLAEGLGLTSFYSPTVFGDVPSDAADQYGDDRYSKIMGSKVYSVHLISQLGYDFLFQDVDIVWYKNPIPFFYKEEPDKEKFSVKEWDMIFQDDGARQLFFAPYSANTGFYFVRHNRYTAYFFNQFLMMGDLILATGSHQSALIVLLVEQASLYGLKIKTWSRMKDEFPGGYSYHQRKAWMKKLILSKNSTEGRGLIENVRGKADKVDPYIFHMSWTLNKINKLKYFKQMGEWYLKNECDAGSEKSENATLKKPTISKCCSTKPLVSCHYKDKPSIIPCLHSPSVDNTKSSFW